MIKILVKFICIACVFSVQAEIHKWTDENGQVHYEDKASNHSQEMQVDVSRKGHVATSEKQKKLIDAFDEDRARKNKEHKKSQAKKKKMKRRCLAYKDEMKRVLGAGSLYDLDKEGNRVTVSKKQREKTTEQFRKFIKKNCR